MKYNEIINYFINNEYEVLLNECEETFDIIGKIGLLLKDRKVNNYGACIDAIQELTGCYLFLNTIAETAKAITTTEKSVLYDNVRINWEEISPKDAKGNIKGFMSAVAENMRDKDVGNLRRTRNILVGYTDSCKVAIGSCQSILKSLNKEQPTTS